MIFYLNNCQGREHAQMYGIGAFYDLSTTGYQATLANHLNVAQQCVVATPNTDSSINFVRYSFSHEKVMDDDTGNPCRVLFGTLIKLETRSRSDAMHDEIYSTFFDKNGNFKRRSVIRK